MHLLFSALLAASSLLPLPKPQSSFDSGMLHVDVYGSGAQSIVFIPGLACGPWSWSEQIAYFSKTYTVYALTLPGFDGRPFGMPSDDLFAAFSTDFWTMLGAKDIVRPIVIGHSLGGTLAIDLAEEHPERLRAVVALDGLPVFPATDAQRATMAKRTDAIASQTHDQFEAYEVRFMQMSTIDPAMAQPLAEESSASDPRAVAAWAKADLTADLRPELKNATLPLLELMPYVQPSLYTQEQSLGFYQSLLAGAPNVRVVAIPGARHFAMIDQPSEVDAATTEFLAQLR
jgi:pimeloyl-ACP methyl ester carboxylesterase